MTLPSSTVQEVAAATSAAPSSSTKACVHLGCSSKGTNFALLPFNDAATLKATVGAGPGPKAAAYSNAVSGAAGIFIKLPAVAVAAYTSPVTSTKTGTSVITLTGTPLDRYDVVFVITTGATVGVTGGFAKFSLDGGRTFTAPAAILTATTVVLGTSGLTANLGAGSLVALDSHAAYTLPASQSILPQTVTRAGSSTSTLVATGAPEDAYDFRFEVIAGGTKGTAGITYRYSLDGGFTFSAVTALGTGATILPLDGAEASGLTITVGTGTLDASDSLVFATTAPEWQASDAVTALAALRASNLKWSFIHAVGTMDPTIAASLGSVMTAWAAKTKFSFAVGSVRGWGVTSNETEVNWIARNLAAWASFGDTRIAAAAGFARITCPITGRQNRRPAGWVAVGRLCSTSPQIELGQYEGTSGGGVLPSDVRIHDASGGATEHNAEQNSALHDARFITLRTWDGDVGVWFTRGPVMAPAATITRISQRRIWNVVNEVYQRQMRANIEKGFSVWGSTAKAPFVAGDIKPGPAARIEQAINTALKAQTAGMVSAISFILDRTPIQTTPGEWRLEGDVKITGLLVVGNAIGRVGFVDPALDAILTKPAS